MVNLVMIQIWPHLWYNGLWRKEYYLFLQWISYVPYSVFGGQEGCERAVIRFGEEWEFPICCIKMAPLMNKFADALTHRDFLGALMNLGIERSTLGDIYIEDKTGYLFCLKSMAEYITENLTRIRHTSVQCTVCEEPPVFLQKEPEEKLIQISSARTDALIAGVYHLSRTESNELFREQKVFINGRPVSYTHLTLPTTERV